VPYGAFEFCPILIQNGSELYSIIRRLRLEKTQSDQPEQLFSATDLHDGNERSYLNRDNASRVGQNALTNLPARARWFPQGDAANGQLNGPHECQPSSGRSGEGFFMPSRRKFLIDLFAAFAYAPLIGRAATLMPIERSHLGFVDRLRIDCLSQSGNIPLKKSNLMRGDNVGRRT
jgi:hypothetical protein